MTFDSTDIGVHVTAQSIAILDEESCNETVSEVQFPVEFDSAPTYPSLPREIADAIGKNFNGKYSSNYQDYTLIAQK